MGKRWKVAAWCAALSAFMLAGCGPVVRRSKPIACPNVELPSTYARTGPQNFGRHSACTLPTVCTDTKAVEAMGETLCKSMYKETCQTKGDCPLPLDCLAHYSLNSRDIVLRECHAAPDPKCGEEKVRCTCEAVELTPPNGLLACGCDCGRAR